MTEPLTSAEGLELRERIFQPILTYTDAIDSKRFDLLAGAFHADAALDYGSGAAYASLPLIIKRMTDAHRDLIGSQHRLTNFFIDDVEDNAVTTRTYVDALLVGGPVDHPLTYRDVGIYHDKLVRSDGRWLIISRLYKSLWREGDVTAIIPPPSET